MLMTTGEFEHTMFVLVQRAMLRQEIAKGGPKFFLSYFVEEYLCWVSEGSKILG